MARADQGSIFVIVEYTIESLIESQRVTPSAVLTLQDSQDRVFNTSADTIRALYFAAGSDEVEYIFFELQPGLPRRNKTVFMVPQNAIDDELKVVIPEIGYRSSGESIVKLRGGGSSSDSIPPNRTSRTAPSSNVPSQPATPTNGDREARRSIDEVIAELEDGQIEFSESVASGFIPLQITEGSSVNWYLIFIRNYNKETGATSGVQVGVAYMTNKIASRQPTGPVVFKVTKQGRSQQISLNLVADGVLNSIELNPDDPGTKYYMPTGQAVVGFTEDQMHDLVRGNIRGWLGDVQFRIPDRRRLREVEDQIYNTQRFVRLCENYTEPEPVPMVTRRSRRGPVARTTPRPPSEPKPDAIKTHHLELHDGRVFSGRLVGDIEADPLRFIICVGSLEQETAFAADEVFKISKLK